MGIAVFLAMIVNMIVAGASGVAIPMLVRKLGKDPALVSGIFLTTVTDMLGFGLMFVIAIWLLPEI
jgi:magnesium transporter